MYRVLLFLALQAGPFWQSKAPGQWSDDELQRLLTDSPWAQMAVASGQGVDAPPVQVYLATAGPIEQAERERDLRARTRRPPGALRQGVQEQDQADEYRAWLEENYRTQIVLAVRVGLSNAFSDAKETRRMEQESVMRVGRKQIKVTGHFPPSAGDPYLRLAFPRQVAGTDKSVSFELYLPGVAMPFRLVEFKVKDMLVKGRLEI